MVNISFFKGFPTCWVVQDFFQQYHEDSMPRYSSAQLENIIMVIMGGNFRRKQKFTPNSHHLFPTHSMVYVPLYIYINIPPQTTRLCRQTKPSPKFKSFVGFYLPVFVGCGIGPTGRYRKDLYDGFAAPTFRARLEKLWQQKLSMDVRPKRVGWRLGVLGG